MSKAAKILLLFPLMLGGCGNPPVTLKTLTITPRWGWYYRVNSYTSWECSVPFGGLGTYGTGPEEPVGDNEIAVGYEDMYVPGAQPLPCYYKQVMLYRGHLQFDLSQFDRVAGATLNINIDKSIAPNCCTTNCEIPPHCYSTVPGRSIGQEDFGNGPIFWDYDKGVDLPNGCGPLIKPSWSLQVANQVNQWLWCAQNNGFIIAGPKLDFDGGGGGLPSDNNANLSWYSGFSMDVLYNPALNPRAPQ